MVLNDNFPCPIGRSFYEQVHPSSNSLANGSFLYNGYNPVPESKIWAETLPLKLTQGEELHSTDLSMKEARAQVVEFSTA